MNDVVVRDADLTRLRTRTAACLLAPVAPLVGLGLAYRVCHPRPPARHRSPEKFGLAPEELWIPASSGGGLLHGWLCLGDPDRVVVLGHGLGLEKSHSLIHAQFLHRAGYTVALFDFRNHGSSFTDRSLTRFNRRFVGDVVAVVEYLRRTPRFAEARIAAYGLSFSSFAILDALNPLAGVLDAMVCDSGPTPDPIRTVRAFLRSGLLPVPRVLRCPPSALALEMGYAAMMAVSMGSRPEWPPAPERAGYGGTPMFFVTGAQDQVVAPAEVKEVAARYPLAEVLVLPGSGHLRGVFTDAERYRSAVLGFLARALGKPGEVE